MKVIDLVEQIALKNIPKRIKYNDYEWEYDGENYKIQASSGTYMNWDYIIFNCLNEEVEIIEEEKELHANSVEFNINNDKKDCIITLDENDLGIDKLHLDNCYFYKENDKWYVKKCDFKSFKLGEEHKIPEKLDYIHPDISCSYNESELLLRIEANKDKINEILDYLEEKEIRKGKHND